MDIKTSQQRSYNMSRIHGKNTNPELLIRKILWKNGFRYRLHIKDLPGKPDIVFPGRKKIILVHGCFWHMHDCKYFKLPAQNRSFWEKKLRNNKERDIQIKNVLMDRGWKILIIWECEIKNMKANDYTVLDKLKTFLGDEDNNI